MKKLATILTAVVLMFSFSSFAAGPDKISARVKTAFEKNFSSAENVTWTTTDGFYFASFQLNNVNIDVAYNEDGELVGSSRIIKTAALPLRISLALAEKYSNYSVTDNALELSYGEGTYYYVTVSNEKHIIKLKCDDGGNISVESKIKKQS